MPAVSATILTQMESAAVKIGSYDLFQFSKVVMVEVSMLLCIWKTDANMSNSFHWAEKSRSRHLYNHEYLHYTLFGILFVLLQILKT